MFCSNRKRKIVFVLICKTGRTVSSSQLVQNTQITENRLLGTPKVQRSRKNKEGSIYQGWERKGPLPFYKISCLPRNRFLWTTDSLDRAGSRPPTSNLMLTDWSREVTHPLWSYSLEWHCALVLILAILAFFSFDHKYLLSLLFSFILKTWFSWKYSSQTDYNLQANKKMGRKTNSMNWKLQFVAKKTQRKTEKN